MSGASPRSRALAYLAAHHVMTLATAGAEGPWAAAVFYLNRDWTLYFLSAATSRHGRNIGQSARVSAAIQEDYSDWREIKGVQLEGTASRLSGADETRVRALYGAKFPFLRGEAPAEIGAAMAKISWYRIATERAWFVDNSVAFGHRAEIDPA